MLFILSNYFVYLFSYFYIILLVRKEYRHFYIFCSGNRLHTEKRHENVWQNRFPQIYFPPNLQHCTGPPSRCSLFWFNISLGCWLAFRQLFVTFLHNIVSAFSIKAPVAYSMIFFFICPWHRTPGGLDLHEIIDFIIVIPSLAHHCAVRKNRSWTIKSFKLVQCSTFNTSFKNKLLSRRPSQLTIVVYSS